MRVAGIMSGTSLDGIDVAVVDIKRGLVTTIAHTMTAYPDAIRQRILGVSNSQCATSEISRLNFELGELYAKAVKACCRKHNVPLDSIELCGCHGQTIYHEGQGLRRNTLQIGEADVIAERLGVPVVSGFRTRDMAAGGQGAPLVPFADYLLFANKKLNRVALNIGGIANITILPQGGSEAAVIAFDTGPGNMIVDQLVERLTAAKHRFDRNGALAAGGTVNKPLLDVLLKNRYFRAKPPKTAGREQYGAEFTENLIASGVPLIDLIATATAFTAATIAAAVYRFAQQTDELIAAGGGTHNRTLMNQLTAFLPTCRITTTAEFGVDPDAKEAVAFAILAWRTWHRQTGNLPGATGAARAVVLGKISAK